MKRTRLNHDACPVARSLDAVGDAWSMLIVRDAFAGKRRFCEFEKSLGIAKNILTTRLKKLVGLGVLEQMPAPDGGAFQDYLLTEKGRGLVMVLVALGQWGGGPSDFQFVEAKGGKTVRLELRSEDGRKVGMNEVRLVEFNVSAGLE